MNNNWKKFIPVCMLGNVIELYEFIIFGYFASIISNLFFFHEDKYAALFATFAVFATGSMVRPFCALFLGYLGDKLGRRISLIISIGLMSISTLGIGLLPTYAQIGILAPIMLLLFKVGQGISMTSEEVGAALFLMENAPHKEKGYASCFILGGVFIGLCLGAIASAVIFSTFNKALLLTWGWRIPFIVGGVIGLLTLFIRIKQPESYEFSKILLNKCILINPIIELVKKNKLAVLRITLLCSLFAVAIYLFAVYIPSMLNNIKDFKSTIMLICSLGFLLTFFISLLTGKVVDKIGPAIPLNVSTFGFLLFSYPIFHLLLMKTLITIFAAYFMFAILLGISAGSLMYVVLQSFPVNIRFSGSCIAFNLSMSIFGGTAPLLALSLTKRMHNLLAPAYLLMGTACLTLLAIFIGHLLSKEKKHGYQVSYQNG